MLELKTSLQTLLRFESDQCGHWGHEVLEVLVLDFVELGVDLSVFVPLVVLDVGSSLGQSLDQLTVLVRELNSSDSDLIQVLESLIGNIIRQNSLQFFLHVDLESEGLTFVSELRLPLVNMVLKVSPLLWLDSNVHSVVASSNGLHIPVNLNQL